MPPSQNGGYQGGGQNPQYGGAGNGQNPQYGGAQPQGGYSGQYGNQSAPIIVRDNNNNGLGNAMLGFLLGRSMSNSHANTNQGYGGSVATTGQVGTSSATVNAPAREEGSFFGSLLRVFAWLVILAVVGWLLYFGWKFLRRGKAPSTANYTFERD